MSMKTKRAADIDIAAIYAGESEIWVEQDGQPCGQDPDVFYASPEELNILKRFIKPGVTHKQARIALETLAKRTKSGDKDKDFKKVSRLVNFNMTPADGFIGFEVMHRILSVTATEDGCFTDAGVATLLRFARDLRNPEWAARANEKLREADAAHNPKVH
jgi:mannitol-1-phosphate/altronate dehydrogenase